MALAGVEGAVGGDTGDLLVGRDLIERFGQHGRGAEVAGREPGRPDFKRSLVNSDVDLVPDAALRATALALGPFAFTSNLIPVLSVGRCSRP